MDLITEYDEHRLAALERVVTASPVEDARRELVAWVGPLRAVLVVLAVVVLLVATLVGALWLLS